jgi:5-deoxy-glucuronate isomerase
VFALIIRQDKAFNAGYNAITSLDDKQNHTLMEYGMLILGKSQSFSDNQSKEKAYLLVKGKAVFEWEGHKAEVTRDSFLDENPCCLHVPAGVTIKVTSLRDDTEISVSRTFNDKNFTSKFYSQQECMTVEGGKGELGEASLRSIRTIFDYSNAPDANLVLGEVVHQPGRWSSYPPHHHPQPEMYYYKFLPEQGFGYSELGEQVFKVKNNDVCVILDDVTHPQVAAPGYAMYYIWVIRHLENNPWDNTRIYTPEHSWLREKGVKIWPDK